jgi:5-methyltetrahydropteroyltriglutamate--homocysteine methyltransferase
MPQPQHKLLPTSLVGSYPQPDWLVDRDTLRGRFPPRVRAKELWRVDPRFLEEAQDDATLVAIRDQERAGLDIVTDGEMRRESYSNRFATALEGIDIDNPGTALDRSGHPNPVPRIAGKIRRKYPVQVRDTEFLRRNTTRTIKMTVPGPFTMSQQAQNDFYKHAADAALNYARAVNEEIKDLFAAGADVVQIDEPYMQARPQAAREYGIAALNAALDGVKGATCVHICFGYAAIIHARPEGYSFLPEFQQCRVHQVSIETAQSNLDTAILDKLPDKTIVLGVIDLDNMAVETPEVVAARISRAFPHCPPDRIVVAPDCGVKYLPREVAYGKMVSMVKGAALVREALETARDAVDKSKKRKSAAPEIRAAAKAQAKPVAAKRGKAAPKAAPKAKAKTKPKAAKKR